MSYVLITLYGAVHLSSTVQLGTVYSTVTDAQEL